MAAGREHLPNLHAKASSSSSSPPAVVRFGKYELLAVLGQGGMAQVFLARHRGPHGFEKLVVVKMIHGHLANQRQFISLFLDEAKLAARINHPNVVQIYELGQVGPIYFMAMEYLVGESLLAIVRRSVEIERPLAPAIAAAIVAEAAEGLHAAHEQRGLDGKPLDVVHRDVSPGNIVVLYEGGVKVVDFGVAKARGRASQTVAGEVKGKFAYMSPEQVKEAPVDRRSDVFALGVVLWEALALRRLFRAESPAATVMAIVEGNPKPPSFYRPGIPAELEQIALRALARDPAARFQTAEEMHEALLDALHHAQSRVGSKDLRQCMQELFADRIRAREELLERVSALGAAGIEVSAPSLMGPVDDSQPSSLVLPWSVDDMESEDASVLLRTAGGSEEEGSDDDVSTPSVEFEKTSVRAPSKTLIDPYFTGKDVIDFEQKAGELAPAPVASLTPSRRGLWAALAGTGALVAVGALVAALVAGSSEDSTAHGSSGKGSKGTPRATRLDDAAGAPDEKTGAPDEKTGAHDEKTGAHDEKTGAHDEKSGADEGAPKDTHAESAAPATAASDLPPPDSAVPYPGDTAPDAAPHKAPKARRPAAIVAKKPPPPTDAGAAKAPAATGRLFLATDPPATVFLGKKRLGDTPLVGVALPVGTHKLTAVGREGRARATFNVTIAADKDTRVLQKL